MTIAAPPLPGGPVIDRFFREPEPVAHNHGDRLVANEWSTMAVTRTRNTRMGTARILVVSMIAITAAGCSTSSSKDIGPAKVAGSATPSPGDKAGYRDPMVSNAAAGRQAAASPAEYPAAPEDSFAAEPSQPAREENLAEAVGRPTGIRAGSASIFSAAMPQEYAEQAPEEAGTGIVPAYIPPTGINAMRGSVFSSPAPRSTVE